MPRTRKKSPLQLRVKTMRFHGSKIIKIEVKGEFPRASLDKNLEFLVSLFDTEDQGVHPILSVEKIFQETFSSAFESRIHVGHIDVSTIRLDHWMPAAIIPEEVLAGPYIGKRTIVAAVRLVDADVDAFAQSGNLVCDDESLIWKDRITFVCNEMPYGYVKFGKARRRIESITLKLGLAIAMADGEYHEVEKLTIQNQLNEWIESSRHQYDGLTDKKCAPSYKSMLSRALKKAHENDLDPDALVRSLQRKASPPQWCDALDFCYKVMSANGILNLNQLRLLREIVINSHLEDNLIDKVKDQTILHLNLADMVPDHFLELLCIDSKWPKDRIRYFLRQEYKKWNGRLNTIPEGTPRQNAQTILDFIGKAYRQYSPPKIKTDSTQRAPKKVPSLSPNQDPGQLEIFSDARAEGIKA